MRASLVIGLALVGTLTACEQKPDFIEMDPKEHVFKRPGEDLWWHIVAKTRQGKTLPKQRGKAVWSTSDEKVITVEAETGKVKAVGPGSAMVRAAVGQLTAEAPVEVIAVGKVTVAPTELKLEARGDPMPITMEVFDTRGRPLKDRMPMARCMNEDVCRTAADGVHPVDPGTTKLVVTAEGAKAEAEVTVVPSKEKKD
jgi:hypothetical protein